jgi:hypothetical protein
MALIWVNKMTKPPFHVALPPLSLTVPGLVASVAQVPGQYSITGGGGLSDKADRVGRIILILVSAFCRRFLIIMQ